jgi:hypothetical protein
MEGQTVPKTEKALRVHGHCYCGAITFAVSLDAGDAPIFTAYCHCDSCRRAHFAPLYHVVCVEASMFSLTSGSEHLNEFTKPGKRICRAFCQLCGSRILNRFPGWKPGGRTPLAFFPNLLDEKDQHPLDPAFAPEKHNRGQECVLDVAFLRAFFEDHAG